jgi:SAM-dependent methyltransferase
MTQEVSGGTLGGQRSETSLPDMEEQRQFWDQWNQKFRGGQLDDFMSEQRAIAFSAAKDLAGQRERRLRILDVGCGTGWLGATLTCFGDVTGVDLSKETIAEGKRRFPHVNLIDGDFLTMPFGGRFDLAISADSIAHVGDQQVFVARCYELLEPGGIFLLMTQNPTVWNRKSSLSPRGKGQIRNWPPLDRIKGLLSAGFDIVKVTSIVPGGDRGWLFWVENRWLRAGARLVFARERWDRFLGNLLIGRELVVLARKRG